LLLLQPKSQKIIGKWSVTECSITNLDEIRKSELARVPDSLMEQYKAKLEDQINSFVEEGKKQVYSFDKDSFEFDACRKNRKRIMEDQQRLYNAFPLRGEGARPEILNVDAMTAKEMKLSFKVGDNSSAVYVLKKD